MAVPSPELHTLLEDLLGRDGLTSDPAVTHHRLVEATCDLLLRSLEFDECWVQPARGLGAQVVRWSEQERGVWTANPAHGGPRGTRRGMGAMGGVPVVVDGTTWGCLMVWSRAPRAWSSRDRQALRDAGAQLGAALQATAARQRTDRQRAVADLEEMRHGLINTLNHELRTPLTSLLGGLDLLLDGVLGEVTPEQQAMLERLERSVTRLQELAQNVTRLTADPVDTRPWDRGGRLPRTDLFAVVTSAVQDVDLARRRLCVEVSEPPETVHVELPAADLREVLDRLLSNAVKFTPDGGRVTVRTGLVSERSVELVVDDTGVGVPVAEHRGLGQEFFRSSIATREEKQGSGLGLAAARRVVEGHGGTLDIVATEQVGTHVCLTLPRARPDAPGQAGTEAGTADSNR